MSDDRVEIDVEEIRKDSMSIPEQVKCKACGAMVKRDHLHDHGKQGKVGIFICGKCLTIATIHIYKRQPNDEEERRSLCD